MEEAASGVIGRPLESIVRRHAREILFREISIGLKRQGYSSRGIAARVRRIADACAEQARGINRIDCDIRVVQEVSGGAKLFAVSPRSFHVLRVHSCDCDWQSTPTT